MICCHITNINFHSHHGEKGTTMNQKRIRCGECGRKEVISKMITIPGYLTNNPKTMTSYYRCSRCQKAIAEEKKEWINEMEARREIEE